MRLVLSFFINPIGASVQVYFHDSWTLSQNQKLPLPVTLATVAGSTGPPLPLQDAYQSNHLRLNASGGHRRDPFGIVGGNINSKMKVIY